MVDHNETNQAIGAIEEAELVEILDHHRLGSSTTHVPIRFTIDVVGSTSTLVTERIEESGLSAPPDLAVEQLSAELDLADPAQIQIIPDWWPRLPILPFRILITNPQTDMLARISE